VVTGIPAATAAGVPEISTNQEWALTAEQDIQSVLGYPATVAQSSVGKYLGQAQSLTATEANAIRSLVAEIGKPPIGGPYRILTAGN
jgi:hypothetical protein